MLLLASYDVVFQEVPGETTLALNLSACPNRCEGCHSVHLQEAVGEELTDGLLEGLLARYGGVVTCVGFMGGDIDPAEVSRLAGLVKGWRSFAGHSAPLKTAWYSGRARLADGVSVGDFDFIKLGPYVEALGGLSEPATNQRFFRVEGGRSDGDSPVMVDATELFRKKPL